MPPPPEPVVGFRSDQNGKAASLLAAIIKNADISQADWAAIGIDLGTTKRGAEERWKTVRSRTPYLGGVTIKGKPKDKQGETKHTERKVETKGSKKSEDKTAVKSDAEDPRDIGLAKLNLDAEGGDSGGKSCEPESRDSEDWISDDGEV